MSEMDADWVARLQHIVGVWPPRGSRAGGGTVLADELAPDFDTADLENEVPGVKEIEGIDRRDDSVAIRFWDGGGTLQRAVFRRMGTDEWKLEALKFQCPICFGEGTNDGEQCLGCLGEGWGAG